MDRIERVFGLSICMKFSHCRLIGVLWQIYFRLGELEGGR